MNEEIKATLNFPKSLQELEEQFKAACGKITKSTEPDLSSYCGLLSAGSMGAALNSPFARFFKNAIEENARHMEEQSIHHPFEASYNWVAIPVKKEEYTFAVTTITNDRIVVKAADCYIDEGSLVFEDDNDITIMIIAPGHWVKVNRLDPEEDK